ncbi:DUF1634 domain-containing protein [Thermodesulfobacteriota bacterium]
MATDSQRSLRAGPEQLLYASILEKGMYFGLLILLITYAIYVSGVVTPYLPHAEVPLYWSLNVSDYLHQANISPGWAWVRMVGYGDFLNFIGIAILAGVSIVCYASIVPLLWKNGDKVYAVLAVTEIIILTIAASGILGSAGH